MRLNATVCEHGQTAEILMADVIGRWQEEFDLDPDEHRFCVLRQWVYYAALLVRGVVHVVDDDSGVETLPESGDDVLQPL